MGSYENVVKIEEIKKKISEGDLLSAQRILDTMEIRKIKNMADINLLAGVYADNARYEEASDLYIKIYEKAKSRKALFQLIEMLIKLNNAEEAEYYLRQYQKLAPKDFQNYVFRYKIDKLKGESFEHLIELLEELKKVEYTEKWAYELAKLYYKAGMEEECIRECSDIELWFGDGTYVEKARILRSTYSGEADKDRIMEEIRRRAEMVSSRSDDSSRSEQDMDTYYVNQTEEDPYPTGKEYDMEGELYTTADFMIHEDTEEFEDGLKKDIQNILIDEQPDNTPDYEYDYVLQAEDKAFSKQEQQPVVMEEQAPVIEELPANQEELLTDTKELSVHQEEQPSVIEELPSETEKQAIYQEKSPLVTVEQHAAVSSSVDEVSVATTEDTPSEREKAARENAEREVEQTIYQMLREDALDEEDRKLKQLSEELQIDSDELFGNFLHVLSVKKQLVKSLEMIMSDRSRLQMMIITGTEGSGKTTLAKDIALFFYKSGKLKSSKLAKISADRLNTIDIAAKKDILKDCCLVVESASQLKRVTIDSILELANQLHGDIAIIFEEDKKNMNKLFREYPKLMDLLKNRIHLPQYNLEDLTGFALACLSQKDYRLDRMAEPVLQGKINQIVKQSEPHRYLEQIYDLMLSAMNAADIRVGKQLSELASKGRLKDVEAVMVMIEDLNIKP